ncbi:MAG: transcriptional repressor [Proteobacteria bacterium]|nr:transcriptional repressor [Pseudomonadota bacterium]
MDPNQNAHEWVWQKLGTYLSDHDCKDTQPRRTIIEYFLNHPDQQHVSAEQVHQSLKDQGHKLGLATVYRSLNLLVDADILEQHHFQNDKAVYELKYPEGHHDHLVCLDCGDIKEFEDEYIEERQQEIAMKLGFDLASHRLELFGHCKQKSCPSKTSS